MRDIETKMSSEEFRGWAAYYQIEPFGSQRDNWHAAVIAHLIANAFRSSGPPVKVEDFMYVDEKTAAKRRDDSMLSWLMLHSVAKND